MTWQVYDGQPQVYVEHLRLIYSSSLHKTDEKRKRVRCFSIQSCRIPSIQSISAMLVYDGALCALAHTNTHTCQLYVWSLS